MPGKLPTSEELEVLDQTIDALIQRRMRIQEDLIAKQSGTEKTPSKAASLIYWFGGKSKMASRILPILEATPHSRYVEPFGGGAAILIRKSPKPIEVYNDINSGLVNFFRVMASSDKFSDFYRKVMFLPYSRELFERFKQEAPKEANDVDAAVKWYFVARASFSGIWGWSFSNSTTFSSKGMAAVCSKWQTAISNLPAFHKRLVRVQIEHQSWEKVIERYDSKDTLFYCDPTYPHDTRGFQRYKHELDDKAHEKLLNTLTVIKGKAAISTYPGDIYDQLLDRGWTVKKFNITCNAAGRTKNNDLKGTGSVTSRMKRTEVLFCSPGFGPPEQPLPLN